MGYQNKAVLVAKNYEKLKGIKYLKYWFLILQHHLILYTASETTTMNLQDS